MLHPDRRDDAGRAIRLVHLLRVYITGVCITGVGIASVQQSVPAIQLMFRMHAPLDPRHDRGRRYPDTDVVGTRVSQLHVPHVPKLLLFEAGGRFVPREVDATGVGLAFEDAVRWPDGAAAMRERGEGGDTHANEAGGYFCRAVEC